MSCGKCYNCADAHPAYCEQIFQCNFQGEDDMNAYPGDQNFQIAGGFFGQSSFASRAIVKERSVVNVAGLNLTEEELKLLAPLGCAVQTGCGAFTNIANVQAQDEVAVLGVGAVGQSAVMVCVPLMH